MDDLERYDALSAERDEEEYESRQEDKYDHPKD